MNHSNFYRSSIELVVVYILTRNFAWTQTLQPEGFITKLIPKLSNFVFSGRLIMTPMMTRGKIRVEEQYHNRFVFPRYYHDAPCVFLCCKCVAVCCIVFQCVLSRSQVHTQTHKHTSIPQQSRRTSHFFALQHLTLAQDTHVNTHMHTQTHTNTFLNNLAAPHTFLLSNSSASVFIVFSLEGAKR